MSGRVDVTLTGRHESARRVAAGGGGRGEPSWPAR